MSRPSAESSFNRGLVALADSRNSAAADLFLAAMRIEARHRVRNPDLRYLSYYGLSLARAHRALNAATSACELAARREPGQPVLLLNLGHVHLLAGRTSLAIGCFERALALAPDDATLRQELTCANRRACPVIRALARDNPLNHWAGRLRHALRRRAPLRGAPPRARAA
jgi:tetratricopeptide (TPR) repeat protein